MVFDNNENKSACIIYVFAIVQLYWLNTDSRCAYNILIGLFLFISLVYLSVGQVECWIQKALYPEMLSHQLRGIIFSLILCSMVLCSYGNIISYILCKIFLMTFLALLSPGVYGLWLQFFLLTACCKLPLRKCLV